MNESINVQDIISKLKNSEMDSINNTKEFEKYLIGKEFTKIYNRKSVR